MRPTSRFWERRRLAGGRWRRGILCRVAGGSARFRKIAAAGANLVAVVVGEFDFYFVVAAVGNKIGGAVGDGVLIAKLGADVLERLIQVINVIREKSTAAGFVREIFENLIAFSEMHFAIGQFGGMGLRKLDPLGAGADGVNDDVGALRHFNGFAAGVIGKIVIAIADQDHYSANNIRLIAGRPRRIAQLLRASFVDGVIDCGASAGASLVDFIAKQGAVSRKALNDLRLVVKGHCERLVFSTAQNAVEKIDGGLLLEFQTVPDAVGSVQK